MIQYIVCPGILPSRTDGVRVYVSAPELIRLYRVSPDECVILEAGESPEGLGLDSAQLGRMVYLFPNAHARYQLPGGEHQ